MGYPRASAFPPGHAAGEEEEEDSVFCRHAKSTPLWLSVSVTSGGLEEVTPE